MKQLLLKSLGRGAAHQLKHLRKVELIGGKGQPLRRQPEDGDELLAVNETDVTRVESLRQVLT
jgi:hypothetical protein